MSGRFYSGASRRGKSTVARLLQSELYKRTYPRSVVNHSDYRTLYRWSRSSDKATAFEVTEFDGFKVADSEILNAVLQQIKEEVLANPMALHVVEFARPSYAEALRNFPMDIADRSLVLYVDTPLERCLLRNSERASARLTFDSGFVPPDVMRNYYANDDFAELQKTLGSRTAVIQNGSDGLAGLADQVKSVIDGRFAD